MIDPKFVNKTMMIPVATRLIWMRDRPYDWPPFHYCLMMCLSVLLLPIPTVYAQDDLRAIPDPDPMVQKEMLHVAEGFEVNLFAAEPMVVKPIQMNWDAKGRLWVAGSTAYPQLRPGEKPNDKIYVLEDTNGDGVADKSTVFADGLLMPTGILPGDGGVYVANSTEIIHLRDTNGDGKADQRRVVLSGFGTADTHHLIHTFRWGPEGKLYFNQSIYIFSHVETPHGVRRLEGGGVWQLRPETLELDVYARGLVNPWGLQFDRWGQSFLTDGAGGEGINYGFPGAAFTAAQGAERTLAGLNPGQPKHSGLEVVSGRHLPESWAGSLITNDYRANRINRFVLEEHGSGFTSEQVDDLLWSNHVAFRPIDVTIGPDGAIYIADWYNPIIQHGEVDFRDERRDQQRGRIWRITAKDRPEVEPPDLVNADIRELLDALKLPEKWTRTQARQVLKERGKNDVIDGLEEWLGELDSGEEEYEHHLLEALWVYQAKDVVNESLLTELLNAGDHRARAAALRTLYYWQERVDDALGHLKIAVEDPHPKVQQEAVIALRRLRIAEAAETALVVLNGSMDEYLDFALWQTIRELEPYWMDRLMADPDFLSNSKQRAFALKSVDNPDAVRLLARLYREEQVPEVYHDDVLRSVARWGDIPELNTLYDLAMGNAPIHNDGRAAYLAALEDAANRQDKKPDRDLNRIASFIESDDEELSLSAVRLIGNWGLTDHRDKLEHLANSSNRQMQQTSLRALAALGDEESHQVLMDISVHGDSPELRKMAVIEVSSFDSRKAAALAVDLLQNWEEGPDPVELFRAFFGRTEATRALADKLSKNEIPEELARAGRQAMQQGIPWYRRGDEDSTALAEALEASGGTLPPERMPQDLSARQINDLEREVRTTADPARGEKIYRMNTLMCMNCHAIGGAGGIVGPDLSSLGRSAPTDNIIHALIEPNRNIKEGYELTRVERADGSSVMGTLIRQTTSEVVMRDAADREVAIPASRVEALETVPGSLMPPGLTSRLEREEFVDLVGFLSQLGEPGEFRVPNTQVVRRWRVMDDDASAAGLIRDNGMAYAAEEDSQLRWRNTYSTVAGSLPLDELPALELQPGRQYSFLRFEVDVTVAGNVALSLTSPDDIQAWVGGQPLDLTAGGIQVELDEGTHRFTLAVDRTNYTAETLQIELLEADTSPAQARLVLGK